MKLRKSLSVLAIAGAMFLAVPVMAEATPHFTLTPATGSQTMGTNFSVVMGVDSDTEKVVGIDIKASFDSSKLEVVSIEKGTVPDSGFLFSYTSGQAIIHNDTGSFEVTLTPLNQSVLLGTVAKQELLKVTFKPKAIGTATFSYVCQPGSLTETNIINAAGADVVDCTANQSGSYTIAAGTGTDSSNTTLVTTPTTAAANSALPKTGGVSDTIALILVGISSIGAALYFKFL